VLDLGFGIAMSKGDLLVDSRGAERIGYGDVVSIKLKWARGIDLEMMKVKNTGGLLDCAIESSITVHHSIPFEYYVKLRDGRSLFS
jgi:hypothetical protein